MELSMNILVVNAGSSSIKIAFYEYLQLELINHYFGKVDWEEKRPHFTFFQGEQVFKRIRLNKKTNRENLKFLFSELKTFFPRIDKIGHRIVHGGEHFKAPVIVSESVKKQIESLKKLAPLHNPIELLCINLAQRTWKSALNIAVFDTAYFKDLPDVASTYPLPFELKQKNIKRYGFHGINHEYCVREILEIEGASKAEQKIITCHLGSGCSISASLNTKCMNTSMGFTPLDGVMMGTRPGSLDPGILIYLLKNKVYNLKELEETLNHKSGLLGVSKLSENMREILKKKKNHPRARLAFELFILSVSQKIAGLMVDLGGCDHLIFTGGIGENCPEVRQEVLKKLAFLGFKSTEDPFQAKSKCKLISLSSSLSKIWVIEACEEKAISIACQTKN
jgi:acetate kinase